MKRNMESEKEKKNANELLLTRDSLFRRRSLAVSSCFPGQRLLAELQWRDGNTKRDFSN